MKPGMMSLLQAAGRTNASRASISNVVMQDLLPSPAICEKWDKVIKVSIKDLAAEVIERNEHVHVIRRPGYDLIHHSKVNFFKKLRSILIACYTATKYDGIIVQGTMPNLSTKTYDGNILEPGIDKDSNVDKYYLFKDISASDNISTLEELIKDIDAEFYNLTKFSGAKFIYSFDKAGDKLAAGFNTISSGCGWSDDNKYNILFLSSLLLSSKYKEDSYRSRVMNGLSLPVIIENCIIGKDTCSLQEWVQSDDGVQKCSDYKLFESIRNHEIIKAIFYYLPEDIFVRVIENCLNNWDTLTNKSLKSLVGSTITYCRDRKSNGMAYSRLLEVFRKLVYLYSTKPTLVEAFIKEIRLNVIMQADAYYYKDIVVERDLSKLPGNPDRKGIRENSLIGYNVDECKARAMYYQNKYDYSGLETISYELFVEMYVVLQWVDEHCPDIDLYSLINQSYSGEKIIGDILRNTFEREFTGSGNIRRSNIYSCIKSGLALYRLNENMYALIDPGFTTFKVSAKTIVGRAVKLNTIKDENLHQVIEYSRKVFNDFIIRQGKDNDIITFEALEQYLKIGFFSYVAKRYENNLDDALDILQYIANNELDFNYMRSVLNA